MSSGGNFTDFGELVLIIGDFHIPLRKAFVPPVFRELLNTDKIKTVICTGNACSDEIVEMLREIASDVHIVKGDMDSDLKETFPETKTIKIGNFNIAIIHGHQVLPWNDRRALEQKLRELGGDILIYGNSHVNDIFQCQTGKYLISPGSVTGAPNYLADATPDVVVPSFMLMAVQGPSAAIYVYELVDGKANVAMSEIRKPLDE
jgi:vacuolar protein sorting-associated protein 29